jgi:hypothetical protein
MKNYRLFITISYSVGSCHDDKEEEITKAFYAKSDEEAIAKSKKIIEGHHLNFRNETDYHISAQLEIVSEIWNTHFVREQKGEPAARIKAIHIPAILHKEAHFVEERIPQKS